MKTKILLSLMLFFFVATTNSFAQEVWGAAISSSGILPGKYKHGDHSLNGIPAIISLEEAKNIFALNLLESKKDGEINRIKVKSYQMTILKKDGTTSSITNNTEVLSDEMKERLKNIESGSKLFFEGMIAIYPNGDTRGVVLLSFNVE